MASKPERFITRMWYAIDRSTFEIVAIEQVGHELIATRPDGELSRRLVAIDETVQGAIREWGGCVHATPINPGLRDAPAAKAKLERLREKAVKLREEHFLQAFARRARAQTASSDTHAQRGLLSRLFAR